MSSLLVIIQFGWLNQIGEFRKHMIYKAMSSQMTLVWFLFKMHLVINHILGVSTNQCIVAASIAFSIRHKFGPGFLCLSQSLCLLCFDVPLFSVVSRAPRPLLIDFR